MLRLCGAEIQFSQCSDSIPYKLFSFLVQEQEESEGEDGDDEDIHDLFDEPQIDEELRQIDIERVEQLNKQQTFTVTAEVHVHADKVRKLLCMCMHPKSLLFYSILTSVINNIFLLQYLAETTGLIDALSPSLLDTPHSSILSLIMRQLISSGCLFPKVSLYFSLCVCLGPVRIFQRCF